jgi:hypothetical protein
MWLDEAGLRMSDCYANADVEGTMRPKKGINTFNKEELGVWRDGDGGIHDL